MHRRNFISLGTGATTALMLQSLDALSATTASKNVGNAALELKILATNWGYPGSVTEFCAAAKKEGYDGAEIWWPGEKKSIDELFAALKTNNLEVGFLFGAGQSNWQEHLQTFKTMVEAAATNPYQRPLYINCHSGRDYFTFDQNMAFIDFTTQLHEKTGILICHETHRSRIMYAAPVCRQYMEKIPGLKLTFDVSHWCNVHESLLNDQEETVNMALERVEHIHARIGHAEGPQVNDPRAPEWETAVKQHFAWWDKVVDRKRKTGGRITVLTEFGPADYMPTLPYTRQPVADQWAINVHMMQLLRKRYG